MTSPNTHGTPPSGKTFHLLGYPIAHSAAPALHNRCFAAWGTGGSPNRYELWSTSRVTEEVLDLLEGEGCGGAAVTMPIKAAILPYLDEIAPEAHATGACNTVVKVPRPGGGCKLVGQNTDILGIHNALLSTLRLQFPPSSSPSHPFPAPSPTRYPSTLGAGLVIGGGATTRSAVYALSLLGLSPIFLVNRDEEEVSAVQDAMGALAEVLHLRVPDDVEEYLVGGDKRRILMAVGAIPAIPPVTREERMVYTMVAAALTVPYDPPPTPTGSLPVPKTRIFLEMAYKPHHTPLLLMARALGWDGTRGVHAMAHQALAQQRMWFAGSAAFAVGCDAGVLKAEVEGAVGAYVAGLGDGEDALVHDCDTEMDRAEGREVARVRRKRSTGTRL